VSNKDILVGIKEIANRLGRSPRTIATMLARRELPAGKVGGLWEASKSELDAFRQRTRMQQRATSCNSDN